MKSETAPSLETIEKTLVHCTGLVDKRLSELKRAQIALQKIKDRSSDAWAVGVAMEALE